MSYDPYFTHVPLLAAAMAASTGTVVECGSGFYSTPMLHEMCKAGGRHLRTLDSDTDWLALFAHLATDWHRLLEVFSFWSVWEAELDRIANGGLGMIFIDHYPHRYRGRTLDWAVDRRIPHIVCHDAEDLVTYKYDFERVGYQTTICEYLQPQTAWLRRIG